MKHKIGDLKAVTKLFGPVTPSLLLIAGCAKSSIKGEGVLP